MNDIDRNIGEVLAQQRALNHRIEHLEDTLTEILKRIRTLETWRAGLIGFVVAAATLLGSEIGDALQAILFVP